MRISKKRMMKLRSEMRRVDPNTVVTLTCVDCKQEFEHRSGHFLRQWLRCSCCGGHYDPKQLKELCLPASKAKGSMRPVAAAVEQAGTRASATNMPQPESRRSLADKLEMHEPMRVMMVTEHDGRKVEEVFTIKGTETPRRKGRKTR